ncbi:MAG: hypothetical protein HRT41_02375 [Campylobacteraceae bacterium]|nr:hypothetical protein [Campylobacteraceae bacterium]
MTEYDKKLEKLQKEFIEINRKRANKWQFKSHQQAIYDFVIKSQRQTSFNVKDYNITLKVGNEDFGFMHFLLGHYGEECPGEITAKDILNIGNVINNDISLPTEKGKKKFTQSKGDYNYIVILSKRKDGDLVISFFSSK